MTRSPLNKDDIAALAKAARLELPETRLIALTEAMPSIFEMLDVIDSVSLGVPAPAPTFRAKWNNQQ